MVVRDAIEQHHVELVVTVIAKGVMVNGPAIDQGVDMTSLHNEHVVGEVKFVVVGHKSPVRVSPMDGDVDGAFVAAARDFVPGKVMTRPNQPDANPADMRAIIRKRDLFDAPRRVNGFET